MKYGSYFLQFLLSKEVTTVNTDNTMIKTDNNSTNINNTSH